jgi:hypothetical protein
MTSECIIWTGHINKDGYGRYNGKGLASGYVHRQAFYEANGYLPDAPNIVGHLCEVRNCYNPDHLAEQTQQENVKQYQDKIKKCPKGHPYDEDNTSIKVNKKTGWTSRRCLTCHREAEARRRAECQTPVV